MAFVKRALTSLLTAVLVVSMIALPAGARGMGKEVSADGEYRLPALYLRADSDSRSPLAKLFDRKVSILVADGDATLSLKDRSSSIDSVKYHIEAQGSGEWSGATKSAKKDGASFSFELPYDASTDQYLYLEVAGDGIEQSDDIMRYVRVELKYDKAQHLNAEEEPSKPDGTDPDNKEDSKSEEGKPQKENSEGDKQNTSPKGTAADPQKAPVAAPATLAANAKDDLAAQAASLDKDGTYEVDTAIYNANTSDLSMCDGVFAATARIVVKGGKRTMYMFSHPMVISGITATLNQMSVNGSTVSTIDRDSAGITKFSFPLTDSNIGSGQVYIPAVVTPSAPDFPPMNKEIAVRIRVNYSTLKAVKTSATSTPKGKKKANAKIDTSKLSLADKAKLKKSDSGSSAKSTDKTSPLKSSKESTSTVKTGDGSLNATFVASVASLAVALFAVLSILDARRKKVGEH